MDGHETSGNGPLVPSVRELNPDELESVKALLYHTANEFVAGRPDITDHAALKKYSDEYNQRLGIEPTNNLREWFTPVVGFLASTGLYNPDMQEPSHPARFVRRIRDTEPEFFAQCDSQIRSYRDSYGHMTSMMSDAESNELLIADRLTQATANRWLIDLSMTDASRLIRQYVGEEVRERMRGAEEQAIQEAIDRETAEALEVLTA